VEAHLDAEIDGYRSLAEGGRAGLAFESLQNLLIRVEHSSGERILFRIKANMGSARLSLGDEMGAASLLFEAYKHAPEEPKAIANRALAHLLREDRVPARGVAGFYSHR
jgi:cellulose synthase operon protein C